MIFDFDMSVTLLFGIFSPFSCLVLNLDVFVKLKINTAVLRILWSWVSLLIFLLLRNVIVRCSLGRRRCIWRIARAQEGRTALVWAAHCGHADCARLLLDAGADKNAKDEVRPFAFLNFSSRFLS
jgi:hypothetical protein